MPEEEQARVETNVRPSIGLNAHLLSLTPTYRGAGINQYIYNLLRHLPRVDAESRYVVFLSERKAELQGLDVRLSRLPTVRPTVRILWEQFIQPLVLLKEGIDLLHCMAFVAPLLVPCPFVVTVYDLSFLLFPQSFETLKRIYLSLFTRLSVRRAARVIAISHSTARDVQRLLGVPEAKVEVVYCGRDESTRPLPSEEVAEFRHRKGLPSRFILFLGTLEPRKNLVHLVEAFSRLRSHDVKLVIAGGKGWGYRELFARIERLGLEDRVLLPGFVPAEEKVYWYNAAELFVYPSLYEGFGLPPLEAMACGTPVIASRAASLPEVVGEGGLLVDPYDVNALAEAMEALLVDRALRSALMEKGLRRSERFSWDRAARETASLYRRALREGGFKIV